MDIATMVAINNLNMMTMMQAMQQRQNVITILRDLWKRDLEDR